MLTCAAQGFNHNRWGKGKSWKRKKEIIDLGCGLRQSQEWSLAARSCIDELRKALNAQASQLMDLQCAEDMDGRISFFYLR